MNHSLISQTINEIYEQYIKTRNSIGIVNHSHLGKFLVSGIGSLDLINQYSACKLDDKIGTSFYTIFLRKKKFISEVLILRLSLYRFLVIGCEKQKIHKILKKARKHYRTCTVTDCTSEYSLFAFHGNNATDFFKGLEYRYIFKTKRQNYTYYQLLSPRKDEDITLKHFFSLDFVPTSLEVEKLFLYNNNVILNIERIPKAFRLSICNEIYPFTNLRIRTRKVKIHKYELEQNFLVTNRDKIYNHLGRKIGIIHCSYRLPYKRYPLVIAFIYRTKAKIPVVRVGKKEALIKPILNY
ncbi:MAG: hypothetical protein GX661_04770 [Acholeplasmataceae bacterium]|nr:hypothetical protein [Acholeplasmataceae bacterium]